MSETRDVAMSLIDPPEIAVRLFTNVDGLEELMESMNEVGLKVPIKLRPRGDRFEVVYGHRRFIAAGRLSWKKITAIIEELSDFECIVTRYHENHGRDEVNPVEDAYYLRELIDKHGLDEAGICKLVKKGPEYIARRLRILRLDTMLIDALAERKIPLGAAEALGQITDDNMRKMYLFHAIQGGHSVSTVKLWVSQWKQTQVPGASVPVVTEAAADTPAYVPVQLACEICGPCMDTYNLRSIMVHSWEITMLHKMVAEAKRKLAGEDE